MADNTLTDMAEAGKNVELLLVQEEYLSLKVDFIISVTVTVQTVIL